MKQRFLAFAAVTVSLGCGISQAALVSPYVETRIIVFGNAVPNTTYGLDTQAVSAASTLNPTTASTITYSGAANATYGQLGASSRATSPVALPAGEFLTVLAVADFADRLIVSSPGSSSTTYRWTPTVRITGSNGWTATGTLGDPAVWAPGIASAQYIRTAIDDTWVRTSTPDIYPAPGPVDIVVTLPEVEIPANIEFNYQMRLIIFSKVITKPEYAVTEAFGQFLNTLRVTGLALTDANGAALPFTVTSASGASYSAAGISSPVPEPATAVLMGVAGLLVAWQRLRARHTGCRAEQARAQNNPACTPFG